MKSPRTTLTAAVVVLLGAAASPVWAEVANTCSAAEQKSLETSFPLINAQVEQMRHSLSYISPQVKDQITRENAEMANLLIRNIVLTPEDETLYRKAAAARICETLTAEDRKQLAAFYQGESGKELAKAQAGLYTRMFMVQAQIFQANLLRAIGTLGR